jgi:uncharacterized protein
MILREKDKERIIAITKKNIKQSSELWAFGSRVNGEAHDTSDLDLVLVSENETKINIDEFVNLKEALRESNIPIIIQVLDWNRIPESFHENILLNYEKITRI